MTEYFAVGTYTTIQTHVPGACGEGILLVSLNTGTGDLSVKTIYTETTDPTYLNWDAKHKKLYTITEDPNSNGLISSFSINSSLEFTPGTIIEGPGKAGCHLISLPEHNRIFAASYLSGSIKGYSLKENEPAENIFSFAYSGTGSNTSRQEASHAHMVMQSPDKQHLYVSDLGSDTIWLHTLDLENNAGSASPALKVPAGYGPRHFAFDPQAPFLYILCELMPKLITASINPADGTMEIVNELDTVMSPQGSPANPAAVKIHPSGNSLAVTNRFADTITIFSITRSNTDGTPRLLLKDEFSCKGKTPRDIAFSSEGNWLIIANQDSNNIEVRRFNTKTGLPEREWGPGLETGSPVCITWLEGLV